MIEKQYCGRVRCLARPPSVFRRLLRRRPEKSRLIEGQIGWLESQTAQSLGPRQVAMKRLAAAPGLGVDSAPQIIAGVGPAAAKFQSPNHHYSWVGTYPGGLGEHGS